MDHELLDQKVDFFADRDDTFSSIKHEFSKIFHENNLHSFTNASDIGFLDMGKIAGQDYTGDYDDNIRGLGEMDSMIGRPYHKGEVSPYMGMNMRNSYSPMTFLQPNLASNVNYSTSFTNMGNVAQKSAVMPDSNYYQAYQPYYYADPSYLEYPMGQPQNGYPQYYDMYNQPDILDSHQNNPLSLMWSNEAKTMNKKTPSDDMLQTNHTTPSKQFSTAPQEQDTPKKQVPFKIEQEFEKVSHKAIGMQMDRATKNLAEPAIPAPRRTTRMTKPLFNTSALHEDESGSDDDKDDTFGGDSKNRSSRGLRVLSLKVRDIVSRKKKTSYKEVADALLQDLSQKLKGKSQAEISKEEQNVKRRVYDALNVLIAADILRKEGKLVCCEPSSNSSARGSKKNNQQSRESIIEQIEEIKKRKKEKLEALQELVFKSLAIKNLVRRNKEKAQNEITDDKAKGIFSGQLTRNTSNSTNGSNHVNATRIDVVQENASLKPKTSDVINFPFIVLLSSSPDNSMNLNLDTTQRQLSIESKKAFNIFGDIDVLLKMRLHYVSKDTFNKEIPKDLRKFVSSSFVDALK